MSSRPATTEPTATEPTEPTEPTDPPPDRAAADTAYYRHVLHQLIDMGLDLAQQLHQQATTPTPDAPPDHSHAPDPTVAFDRIARAVRRTVALARSLAVPPSADAATPGTAAHRLLARSRVIREVEDAIQRARDDRDAGPLHAELRERLDDPDLDDEIAVRPVGDIIADICRDLGIAAPPDIAPWKRRTPADIVDLRALAAQAASARARSEPAAAPARPHAPAMLYPLRL